MIYKGKRKGPALQQIHFSLCLFDGRPEFKFKDEKGGWKGIMRNAHQFVIPGQPVIPLTKAPSVAFRRWSHVAATFDRGRIVLFLNGKRRFRAWLAQRCHGDIQALRRAWGNDKLTFDLPTRAL